MIHITRPRCSNVRRYQGLRKPRCGCAACWAIYLKTRKP